MRRREPEPRRSPGPRGPFLPLPGHPWTRLRPGPLSSESPLVGEPQVPGPLNSPGGILDPEAGRRGARPRGSTPAPKLSAPAMATPPPSMPVPPGLPTSERCILRDRRRARRRPPEGPCRNHRRRCERAFRRRRAVQISRRGTHTRGGAVGDDLPPNGTKVGPGPDHATAGCAGRWATPARRPAEQGSVEV